MASVVAYIGQFNPARQICELPLLIWVRINIGGTGNGKGLRFTHSSDARSAEFKVDEYFVSQGRQWNGDLRWRRMALKG